MATSADQSPVEKDVAPPQTTKYDLLEDFPDKHAIPPKKILFLGDEGVGKTTFITKYCEHVVDYYRCYGFNLDNLVFTQFLVYHNDGDKRILIRLMDLPPGTTEGSRKNEFPDEVDSIVFCFSIDNPDSLANVWKMWLPESRKYYSDFSRYYLLGLKEDTRQGMLEANKTPVTMDRAHQVYQKHKFCGDYMECSVQENPHRAFALMDTLISDVLHSEPPPVAV